MTSFLTTADGGVITLWAYASHEGGVGELADGELFYGGVGTGVSLPHSGDGTYTFSATLGSGVPPTTAALEIQVADQDGNVSTLWPYVTVQ